MLEFKNTAVTLPYGNRSKPFSLVVNDGDIVCLCGRHGSGKSLILQAVLGLAPISDGFITYDGELITPGSSAFFRKIIAYIPQELPKDKIKVYELFHDFFHLEVNSGIKADKEVLAELWEKIGIDIALKDKLLYALDAPTLQLIMLSFLLLLDRKIVLIDNIYPSEKAAAFMSELSATGVEVIYTCNENVMKCDKIVDL